MSVSVFSCPSPLSGVLKERLNQDDVPASARRPGGTPGWNPKWKSCLSERLRGMASAPLLLQYRRIQSAFVLIRLMRISAYPHNRHSWAWNHFGRRPFASGIPFGGGWPGRSGFGYWRRLMTEKHTAGRMRRAVLAATILSIGILGGGTAAWLAGSHGSTWRELYSWYNPAVGFHSAALPVGFEDLVERVKPTVVGVRAKVEQDADDEDQPTGHGAPSSRSDLPKGNVGANQPHVATSQGSGFFISSDGYAMTTNHVVERSEKIEVTTDDGKIYPAKLVGADPKTDLALLKIDGGNEFPAARIADKAPRIGE